MHVVSNHCNFRKQKVKSASTSCTSLPWCCLLRLVWIIKLVLWRGAGGRLPSLKKKKVQIVIILSVEKRFLFAGRSIVIPRCGDFLYFHLLLQYWFIRNIVTFKNYYICTWVFIWNDVKVLYYVLCALPFSGGLVSI